MKEKLLFLYPTVRFARIWSSVIVLLALLVTMSVSAQVAGACSADAGTLNGFKPTDCLQEGGTAIGGIPTGDAVVPAGFSVIYVLTRGEDLVIEQVRSFPIFDVTGTGAYTIHTLVYDPATLDLSIVEFGVTTGFDVNGLLIQGGGSICASLDVAGTKILVDNPDAGTLTAFKAEDCLEGGTVAIGAVPNGDIYVPEGYSVIYVLTEGAALVIQQVSDYPIFDITTAGSYTVHTLVYDPNTLDLGVVEFGVTTGFDVNGLLYQGGGNICGSLDVVGAVTVVIGDCEVEECLADAGTLTEFKAEDCLLDGTVAIGAVPNGDISVPEGYSVIYVLTEGEGLVIQQVREFPVFDITAPGSYTVHTLVYDPNTLDLSIVEFGITTGFDVNGLLVQGGGAICASLDVAGAVTVVTGDCDAEECVADAGTLTLDEFEGCINGENMVTVSVTANGDANVPAGYSVVYVLTEGEGLVIVNAGAEPSFDIEVAGSYTIHTLVYDATTLDLNIVELGVTTGFDVNSLLIQGGGEICGSLDVTGAAFTIEACLEECMANAGTLVAVPFEGCVNGENFVTISAEANGDANVPAGYSVVYVLTEGEGLVIVNAGAEPSFEIEVAGSYTIHTLVYDATTLDLNIVELGVTTGFDVNSLLIQGGGEICGSLDVTGAAFTIDACLEECLANAGSLVAVPFDDCLDGDNSVTISAIPNLDGNVPVGYNLVYVLTMGEDLVLMNADGLPSFEVTSPGIYTIHGLVFSDATLDLDIVEFGVTTGFDVNSLLIQGGGEICGSLDVTGASFFVDVCPRFLSGELELRAWPTSTNEFINVGANIARGDRAEFTVYNMQGAVVIPATVMPMDQSMSIDVQGLRPGQYLIRMVSGDKVATERFMRVD